MNPTRTPHHDSPPELIVRLKRTSSLARKRILDRYLSIECAPVPPPYLNAQGLTESHILRSELEIDERGGRALAPAVYAGWRAYTKKAAKGFSLRTETGSLTEVCMGVIGDALQARAELQVAAGLFSSMVAVVDDYLDCEGLFDLYGDTLYYVSHAYRDLMDMALEEEVLKGHITRAELFEIKERLFGVITTLVRSESSKSPDDYLYEKSCGDKVVSVLFPVSSASPEIRKKYAGLGRLVGEAGQLIDDAIDLDYDTANDKRNYIALKGLSVRDALCEAQGRILAAEELAGDTKSAPISWILGSMKNVTGIMNTALASGTKLSPALMGLSSPLSYLLDEKDAGPSAERFLIWF